MSQIFPKQTNKILLALAMALGVGAPVVPLLAWYYLAPEYTEIGYRPTQPVAYSHKLHAGDLGMDCRFCHSQVEKSAQAGVPATETCMLCHNLILTDSELLAPVRESWASDMPIRWIKVHDLPDYAYFDHSAHVRANIGCISCHGDVSRMEVVTKRETLSMAWCLSCHRDPKPFLRPDQEITNMNWNPSQDQLAMAENILLEKGLAPREACTACHR